jgi:hypothetical protein
VAPTRRLQIGLLAALGAAILLAPASAHQHYAAGVLDNAPANGVPDADESLRLFTASNEVFKDANGQTEPAATGPLRLYHVGGPFAGQEKIFDLLPRPVGFRPLQRCGGYYMLDEYPRTLEETANSPYRDAFSFTALSDVVDLGGQPIDPGHAHTGAYLEMEIVSISGPSGAHFGFWESEWSAGHDTPSVSFATNHPTGNFRFILSEGIDHPLSDPFGHIHERSWTADKPGDYDISFRVVDTSTNRPGGAPWHTPSKIYILRFRAGPSFQPTGQFVVGTGFVLTWPSLMGIWDDDEPPQTGVVFTIQRSTTLQADDWQTLGTVTGTTAATATFTDPAPPAAKAFYRLIYSWSTP